MKHYWEDMEAEYSLQGDYLRGFDYDDEPEYHDEPPPMTIDDHIQGAAAAIEINLACAAQYIEEALCAQENLDDLVCSINEQRISALNKILDLIQAELDRYALVDDGHDSPNSLDGGVY